MKVIELLNRIANGEEVKAKHKMFDLEFYNSKSFHIGYEEGIDKFTLGDIVRILNDEVEVIEEDKKIEKLDTDELFICDNHEHIYSNFIVVYSKINEIIDKINNKTLD